MKNFRNITNGKAKMTAQFSYIRSMESLSGSEAAAAFLLVLRELPPDVLVSARDIVRQYEVEADVRKRSADEALGL